MGKFFGFLKSRVFWQTVAHVAIIGAGSYASYTSGTPLPLVVSGGINALLAAPQDIPPKP